jgi:hypothetical protein
MSHLLALLILTISGLLVLAPPIAVWRTISRRGRGLAVVLLSLIGPFLSIFVLLVLAWLPAYSGQCGGWLGETTPCNGFGQYLSETVFWAVMSLSMPGLLGLLLGLAAFIVGRFRRVSRGSVEPKEHQ